MSRFKNPFLVIIVLFLVLCGLTVLASNAGAMNFSLKTLWQASATDTDWQIWLNIRLPRILIAILVGLALAVSGAIMQGLFRNPLALPLLLFFPFHCRRLCRAMVTLLPHSWVA